jgi:hypothetical protein
MRKRLLIAAAVMVAVGLIIYGVFTAIPSSINLEFDFRQAAQGWEAGFAEYSREMTGMQLKAEIRRLPPELEIAGKGFYIQGINHSDDLFMFLKRRLGPEDGVIPNQEYRVKFTIVFASNAPSGAVGIGGPPGEAVFLRAGASAIEPEVYIDPDTGYYLMNVDKGAGNSGNGTAASITGNIANGLSPEEIDMANPPYVSLVRQHEHPHTVTASPNGELWLLVGTDSGFMGLTGIYYQSIEVTLIPVE